MLISFYEDWVNEPSTLSEDEDEDDDEEDEF